MRHVTNEGDVTAVKGIVRASCERQTDRQTDRQTTARTNSFHVNKGCGELELGYRCNRPEDSTARRSPPRLAAPLLQG